MKTVFNKDLADWELNETKELLYNIRRERGYNVHQFFIRVLFVASYFSKVSGYVSYGSVLSDIRAWLNKKGSKPLDYAYLESRQSQDSKYFGTRVNTLINGTWSQLYMETIFAYKIEMKTKARDYC